MGVTEALIAGAVLAAGTTTYSVVQGNQARADAKDQANKLQADQDAMTAQAAEKVQQDKLNQDNLVSAQKAKQNSILQAAQAPNPISDQSNTNSQGLKTLLGS